MQFNTIYLSFKRDPDLIALYRLLGAKQFQRITKEALRTVARPGYKGASPSDFLSDGDIADLLYKEVQTKEKEPQSNSSYISQDNEAADIRINLCVTAKKDEDISKLLSHVKSLKRGMFVKQALRFYMGANAILRCFMDTDYVESDGVVFSSGSSEESALFEKMAAYLGGMVPTALATVQKETPAKKTERKTKEAAEMPVEKKTETHVPSLPPTGASPSFGTAPTAPSFADTPQDNGGGEDDEAEMLALLEGLLT